MIYKFMWFPALKLTRIFTCQAEENPFNVHLRYFYKAVPINKNG